jgi:hypothetical protein
MPDHGSPVTLLKFQIAPKLMLLISSGSRENEPRYSCMNEVKGSHSQRIGPRFLLSPHTSYIVDCPADLVGEDVSSGCYVQ